VYVPGTVLGAKLVVALVVQGSPGFDPGRAAQNMMLAAWNEGVTSCPNGMPDRDKTAAVLGLGEEQQVLTVLAFGYPARPRDPERRSAEEWIARANRRPFEEVVEAR
jgi:nitroreductase